MLWLYLYIGEGKDGDGTDNKGLLKGGLAVISEKAWSLNTGNMEKECSGVALLECVEKYRETKCLVLKLGVPPDYSCQRAKRAIPEERFLWCRKGYNMLFRRRMI